jgi:type IV secretion system protein VirD4
VRFFSSGAKDVSSSPRPPLPAGISPLRWGSERDLLRPDGLIVGRSRKGLLRAELPGHFLTIGPTRSGKGVGSIVPNLLTYPGSAVVLDPKGENYAITSRARKAMGQQVYAFDPFGIAAAPQDLAAFNPLDLLQLGRRGSMLADDATALAEMLVVRDSLLEPHWEIEAKALLAGVIAHVASSGVLAFLRTLGEVRRLLAHPPSLWRETIELMAASEEEFVRRAAARIRQKAFRERSGVISTAQANTHFLDSAPVAASLAATTLDLTRLKTSCDTTIYLILPPDRIPVHGRWFRVLVGSILQALSRVEGQPEHEVLLFLDEAAVLGDLDVLRRFHSLAAGYGVKFWLFFQDVSQMRTTYGRFWQSFVANSDLIQAFNVADSETARMLCTRARSIVRPRDVLGIDGDHQLLLRRGGDPIVGGRCRYHLDPEFRGLYAPNPMRTRSVSQMQELARR